VIKNAQYFKKLHNCKILKMNVSEYTFMNIRLFKAIDSKDYSYWFLWEGLIEFSLLL